MKVFKFGGASVKNAEAVVNATNIIKLFPNEKIVVVVSAMGKTTNALEKIVESLLNQDEASFLQQIESIKSFHVEIISDLFANHSESIFEQMNQSFAQLSTMYSTITSTDFNRVYDQIVSLGEVFSTQIVEAYFRVQGISSTWADSRKIIRTNDCFREGEVDWSTTESLVQTQILPQFTFSDIIVTQGFIGHTEANLTTTLGREGSDYTAAIYAYCLPAESVTIWKDVAGMLNADPRLFADTIKLDRISYKEAIELAYYGASVIHPKTIKPLQNKNIPLFVKSFIHPQLDGTVIQSSMDFDSNIPSFIIKEEQVLMSFSPRDFSFIDEGNFVGIFEKLTRLGIKVNLMQNTALSFSIVFDHSKFDPNRIFESFKEDYEIKFNESLELVTIRHYDDATIAKVSKDKEVLLEQRTRQTIRMVLKK